MEEKSVGNPYRQNYILSIEKLLDKKRDEAKKLREEKADEILKDPEAARERFKNLLGWPLNEPRSLDVNVKSVYGGVTEYGAEIYRLVFTLGNIVEYYGILFLHKGQSLPLCISQHGGLGTPELCSGLHSTTTNYNDMTKKIFLSGMQVFAPQNYNWSTNDYPVFGTMSPTGTNRSLIDKRFKEIGGSLAAFEITCLQYALDYFEKQEYVNASHGFGMVGLSYGGFYTMMATAVETRIQASFSSSFFNEREKYDWDDWTFKNAMNEFCDAEILLLIYPRYMAITVGNRDELFTADTAAMEYERAKRMACRPDFEEKIPFCLFDGNHELYRGMEYIQQIAKILLKK